MAKDKKKTTHVDPKNSRDHPEQYPTNEPSLFDMWESQKNVDPIPMEDLNLDKKEEKRQTHTKNESSSLKKYHSGFGKG